MHPATPRSQSQQSPPWAEVSAPPYQGPNRRPNFSTRPPTVRPTKPLRNRPPTHTPDPRDVPNQALSSPHTRFPNQTLSPDPQPPQWLWYRGARTWPGSEAPPPKPGLSPIIRPGHSRCLSNWAQQVLDLSRSGAAPNAGPRAAQAQAREGSTRSRGQAGRGRVKAHPASSPGGMRP